MPRCSVRSMEAGLPGLRARRTSRPIIHWSSNSNGCVNPLVSDRRVQAVDVELAQRSETKGFTQPFEFDDEWMIGRDVCLARRPGGPTTMLLTEHLGEFALHIHRSIIRLSTALLVTSEIQATLCQSTNEGHRVFLCLQTGTPRANLVEGQLIEVRH